MIQLFVNHFRTGIEIRDKELDEVLMKNCEHPLIGHIYTIGDVISWPHPKITHLHTSARPNFENIITLISNISTDEDINIIANLDIYFDETLALVQNIRSDQCFALTRWDVTDEGLIFTNRGDSQDCWIFRGKPIPMPADFSMGRIGCDNCFAALIAHSYELTNPSLSIRAIHLHQSGIRNDDYMSIVHGGYQTISCTEI